MENQNRSTSDVWAGRILLASASLSVFAMLHHPTGHSHGNGDLNAIVHGAMMVLLSGLFFGFAHVALRMGLDHGWALAGLIAYSVHFFAHLIAATMNGFIAPTLAAHETEVGHDVLLLCWRINQTSASLGVLAAGAAYSFWGLVYLLRPQLSNKLIGLCGVACGLAPAIFLSMAHFKLDVHTALLIYTAHAAWAVVVGIQILRHGCLVDDEPGIANPLASDAQ